MKWHPYAKLFPMMGEAEIEAMAEDIKANGQRLPCLVSRDGLLIDGRNRSAACALAGVEPTFETFDGDDAEILKLVLSLNLPRRHLTESQRAMVAADLANLPKHVHRPEKPDVPIGASSSTVSEAAEKLKVGERSVNRARKVKEKATPEVGQAVRDGKVSVTKAAQIADKPIEEQPAALAEAIEKPKAAIPDGEDIRQKILDRLGVALEKAIRMLCDTDAGRNVDRAKAVELLGKLVAVVKGQKPEAHPQGDATAILEFPCDGKLKVWKLTEPQVAEWAELFPSLDIASQCRSALAWVKASKDRQKTFRGMPKFLVGWFTRSQDSGKHRTNAPPDKLSGLRSFDTPQRRGLEVSPGVELIGGLHDIEE